MDVSKLLEKAAEATSRRNYDYAIELYLQACTLDPNNANARRSLRAVEIRMAQEKGSSFWGKTKTASMTPQLNTLYMMKKWDSAIQKAEEILKIDPASSGVLLTLGKAAKHAGYIDCAIATFEDIKNSNAGGNVKILVEAARELAHLYENNNRVQEALDIWGYISKQVPGDREVTTKLRDLHAKSITSVIENSQKAGGGGRGAMARLSQTEEQKKAAAAVDLEKGDIKSEADMQAVVKMTQDQIATAKNESDLPKLYEKLGGVYRQFNRYEESKQAYQHACEKDPNNHSYKFKLHDLEIWQFNLKLKALEPQVRANDAAAREQYVKLRDELLQYRLESFLERERQYSTDSRIRFDLGSVYFDLAVVRKDKTLYDEAIKRFQATFKDPKFRAESGLRLGQGFDAKGQYDLALKRYDETLAGFPAEIKDERWKNVMYYKGSTLVKAGRKDEAKVAFYEIYEIDVAFKDVGKKIEEIEAGGAGPVQPEA